MRLDHFHRTHDDCDGDHSQRLELVLDGMGDIHILPHGHTLRFRTPMGGGGCSPRTHKALVELAKAIQEDNRTHPFHP